MQILETAEPAISRVPLNEPFGLAAVMLQSFHIS